VEAERALERARALSPVHIRASVWLAEAQRRQGDVTSAASTLTRPAFERRDPAPVVRAVLARIRVDQGHLDEAEGLLGAHPDPRDPDLLASRWYLARARGEPLGPWSERLRSRGGRDPGLLVPVDREGR
jgi:hypothetical protein